MCLISLKPGMCDHQYCLYVYANAASEPYGYSEDQFLSIINYQNDVLSDIVTYNSNCLERIDSFFNEVKGLGRFLANTRHADLVMETSVTTEQIFSKRNDYKYELKLVEKFPEVLFKERGFSIKAYVQDRSGKPVYLHKYPRFRVFLYSMDKNPRLMNLNVAGKKVLRGTMESEMNEDFTIYFKNLVINEVSSHYTNDGFRIVVANLNSSSVKPLILNGIPVRARRLN